MKPPFALACVVLGTCSVAVVGRQVAAPPQSAPTFRTAVEYVSVDVVVTDKNDKPVTDLRKDEFVITENRKVQTVREFQFVSIPVVARTVEVTQPAPMPPPDVVTNVPPSPKSRLFAIVIDDLHIIEQNLVPMKAMLTDLVNAMSPDDEIAVVFTGRSDMGVNFTTNRSLVMKPIDNLKAALGFGEDALGSTLPPGSKDTSGGGRGSGAGGGSSGSPTPPAAPEKTQETLNHGRSAVFTLRNVAMSLAGSGRSRRAIFFVSGGFPLDPNAPINPANATTASEFTDAKTLRDDLDDAYAEAKRADVPIYTVDPRGLVTTQNALRWDPLIGPVVLEKLIAVQQNYLAEIAINTGGRALMNRSDLKKAVEDVIQENGSYYLLGYSPDPLVRDGKFHDIDVKVTRPVLIVRPRKGYVAPSSTPATTDAKPTLDKAMSAGVNVSGLSLRAFAAPVTSTTGGMTTVVTVQLTYPAPADGSKDVADNLEISIVALDLDGNVKASAARRVHFQSSVLDGADSVTLLIDDTILLPSQPLMLRVGLASKALGRAGTIQLPVDVPKPSDSKLQMGGVAIGFADFGREPTLQRDLISSLVPFQPTTTRTFAAKDTLRIFDRLFWSSKDADADVTITIVGAASRAPQAVRATGAPSTNSPSKREGTIDARVPMADLPAGTYTLRVEAALANGQTARRDVPFEVR